MTACIGCHAKIFDYLNLSGLYSLHGREIATASGFKLFNPNLKVKGKTFKILSYSTKLLLYSKNKKLL